MIDLTDEIARIGPGAYLWSANLARACSTPAPYQHHYSLSRSAGITATGWPAVRVPNLLHGLCKDNRFGRVPDLEEGTLHTVPQGRLCRCRLHITKRYRCIRRTPPDGPHTRSGTFTIQVHTAPTKKTHNKHKRTQLKWLGFHLSATRMRVMIPSDKLTHILTECDNWAVARAASGHDPQRLVGRLQHIAKCIRPAW